MKFNFNKVNKNMPIIQKKALPKRGDLIREGKIYLFHFIFSSIGVFLVPAGC